MAQSIQSQGYQSLHRHVHSIIPQNEHHNIFQIYSSSQQPPLPSILQRSRTKKSQQKSLRKGISRVSKSKQKIQEQSQTFLYKPIQKGKVLNFNIQDVIESKHHITKTRDEIVYKSPLRDQISKQDQNLAQSNQNSLIGEYRIITYVPSSAYVLSSAYVPSSAYVSKPSDSNNQKVSIQNKQNNLNQSNIIKNCHYRNQSQEIQVANSTNQNAFQFNTWRTSQMIDPFYQNNYKTDFNKTDAHLKKPNYQSAYSSLQDKQTHPISRNQNQSKSQSAAQISELRDKIKHLQHEIVEIERQKNTYFKENQQSKSINYQLTYENQQYQTNIQQLGIIVQGLEEKTGIYQKQRSIQQQYSNITFKNNQGNTGIQIDQLQLLNAKMSKQISQKSLQITELNRKNKDLCEKLGDFQRQINKDQRKIQGQQEKLYRKDQKIKFLSLEMQKLNLQLKQKYQQLQNVKNQQMNLNKQKEQQFKFILERQLLQQKLKYDQLSRDYGHLQKKYTFMKDQLDHLKYLQTNTSSSALSYRQNSKYASVEKYDNLEKDNTNNQNNDNCQTVFQLETRLQVSQRTLTKVQSQYSNLKHNFRALEQLYIRQQGEMNELQQQTTKSSQENNMLKIQLTNLQQISSAKRVSFMGQNDSLRLMQKQQALFRLNIDFSNLQRDYIQVQKQLDQVAVQKEQLSKKYLDQLQKGTILSKLHQEEIQLYKINYQKKQNQKTLNIVTGYEKLIQKLNQQSKIKDQDFSSLLKQGQFKQRQITTLKVKNAEQIKNVKRQSQQSILLSNMQIERNKKQNKRIVEKYIQQIKNLEDQLEKTTQKLVKQKKQFQNYKIQNETKINYIDLDVNKKDTYQKIYKKNDSTKERQNNLSYSSSKSKFNFQSNYSQLNNSSSALNGTNIIEITLKFENMSRKQIESFTADLQQQNSLLKHKNKSLSIKNDSIQNAFKEKNILISLRQQQINFFKQQKQNFYKQKIQLCQQLQKTNELILQIKKMNAILEDQNVGIKSSLKQFQRKHLSYIFQNQTLNNDVKSIKNLLYDNQKLLEQQGIELAQIRTQILKEKQNSDQQLRQLKSAKEQRQTHKSKEEYYKMVYEQTQKQLGETQQQLEKICKQLEKQTYQKLTLLSKHQILKQQQHSKRSLDFSQKNNRLTQLYRLQIYKDLNKLLNLSTQNYTLEQIIQKSQQQYLEKLYNAIKQDIQKVHKLKILIVEIEQRFRNQKIRIKQDYDVVYQKYLKYKSMSQSMEKDIQKFKDQLKRKDEKFAGIVL